MSIARMLVREGVEDHSYFTVKLTVSYCENFRTFCLWFSDTPILFNCEGAAILFWILQTTSFAAKLPWSIGCVVQIVLPEIEPSWCSKDQSRHSWLLYHWWWVIFEPKSYHQVIWSTMSKTPYKRTNLRTWCFSKMYVCFQYLRC